MNVPNLPIDEFLDKDGKMSDIWRMFFFQLIQAMQQTVSNEGFQIPQLTSAEIAQLVDPDKTPNGTMVYDTDTDDFKGMKGGVFKTFTLT